MTRPTPVADTSAESRAGDILLLPIALAAFWTLAYQLVLVARWPAQTIPWCFLAIALAGSFLLARIWKETDATPGRGYQFHPSQALLFILAAGCAITVLFIRRPNQDDIVYFHRALAQLSALGRPIFLGQTSVDMKAAAFSPVHLATSHEMLMALLGHYLQLDPLYFYQVIGHVFTAFSIPFVLYWCARRFCLNRWPAAFGALLGVLFLLVDSAGPAGFGNTAFGRMWQGKAIIWILFLPIGLSLSYRYLCRANYSDLLWLTLLAIAGVGLSNTALYLVPAVIGCSCLSFLGVQLLGRNGREDFGKQFRRYLLLATPLAYPVAILALLKLNVIPKPIDIRGFGPEFIPWQQPLDNVVGRSAEYTRDIVIMVTVPLLIVRGKRGLFLFFYICAVWLLCLNPFLAHFWMKNIIAASYFRLVYLLELPLLCAMLAAAGPRLAEWPGGSLKDRMITEIALLAVILSFFYSYRVLSIMPRNAKLGLGWKSPREYQLLPANTDFAQAAGKYIAHSKLLAPDWTASCELPLLFPEMKVVAPRLVGHYFANVENPREGNLRARAQLFVEGGKNPKEVQWLATPFRRVIESGRANAVAAPESESARVLATLQSINPSWHRVLEAGGLVLMLPSDAASWVEKMKAGFPLRAFCNRAAPSAITIANPALSELSASRSTTSRSSSTTGIVLSEAVSICRFYRRNCLDSPAKLSSTGRSNCQQLAWTGEQYSMHDFRWRNVGGCA